MILNDLFESRMSELDIEYQDYKNLEPVAFYSRYKMSKDQWASKHWSLIKSSETVHEGAVKNLHTDLEEKYRELAPSIEKYKDSFLAGQLYNALEAIAIEHGAELEFKRMMTGARNRAHMDYDTNPGGFQNWFWYLPFADDEQDVAESANVNPQFIIAQVTKILATEARRVTNAPMAQLLAPVMEEYGLTLQQIDAMVPGGLKKAAAEYGIMMKEGIAEESQDDRNARIIAGEIEDAMSQGNEKVAQEKIKKLTQLGYYFDKQGRLQRMGMYEQSTARERWNKASAQREKKHADAEKEMKARHARGEEDMKGSIDRLEKALNKPVAEGIPFDQCPNCGGSIVHESQITEKQDACYHKVKSRYKVWPSAYASGALVQCRKKGAANWGNKTKK
jgi:hypothetical protein